MLERRQGYARFRSWRIFYLRLGPRGATAPPLVCVPGGPGRSHHYFQPLEALAEEHPLVLYDTLGSGGSERPTGPVDYDLDFFAEELVAVRRAAGLEALHLFGHSSGGMVALHHLLGGGASGVQSLILASTPASVPAYTRELWRLVDALPPELRDAIVRRLHDPTAKDLAVLRAYYHFIEKHLCRVKPLPAYMTGAGQLNHDAWLAMKGHEVLHTGKLRDFDVTARLGEIDLPTLLLCGRHDPVTPEACAAMAARMPRAELTVFEESSHIAFVEEPTRFVDRVAAWLRAR